MDIPVCVVDAQTLVDRIQDVKRWIYNGQLQLVVPPSTFEQIEQLYHKSIENKTTPQPQDPSRPKSSGKPIRKEYPAFDINPRVAQTFLTRLKTWKEEDAVSEQQEFHRERENHDAVVFQKASEQYTPWKSVEIGEETTEPVTDRPTTWAEALRRKKNLANGISESSDAPKGPIKPKLIARAPGSDLSPWKIRKDAPKVSAQDVPVALRPFMSCALWRLHESIHRNDANQLFLFSDQHELRSVAQKLNIVVKTTTELNALIASKSEKSDTGMFGDVEREFGLQKQNEGARTGPSEVDNAVEENVCDAMKQNQVNGQVAQGSSAEVSHDAPSNAENLDSLEDGLPATTHPKSGEEVIPSAIDGGNHAMPTENIAHASTAALIESKVPEVSAWSKPLVSLVKYSNHNVSESHLENTIQIKGVIQSDISRPRSQGASEHEGQEAVGVPSKPVSHTITAHSEDATQPMCLEQAPKVANQATSIPCAPQTPLSLATHELEDSDEEEIVFKPQPKRNSAQKKPTHHYSRPSTPKSQPPHNLEEQSSQVSTMKPQSNPKPTSHGRSRMVIGHGHPQSKGSLTVIDPDAFGRNFIVKPNTSPRTISSRGHHYPRPHSSHGQSPHVPRSPRRHDARLSPPRHSQDKSSHGSPAAEPKAEPALRTSPHHKSRAIAPEDLALGDLGLRASALGVKPLPPAPKSIETNQILPRHLNPTARPLDARPAPSMEKSTGYQSADLGYSSQTSQTLPEASVRGPKVFETSEFVPRSGITTALYKPRAPQRDFIEPRASMPDVEYVLKSGSTRASARGRGRLWTPS